MSDYVWVDVPNDPAHPLVNGVDEPLNFQALADVDRIIVDEGQGDEVCAYRSGAFRGRYAALSTMDPSRNIELMRQGGWPKAPKVIAKTVDIPAPTSYVLTPTLYSPLAQWALRGAPTTALLYADRSGNNFPLTGGNADPVPDGMGTQTGIRNANALVKGAHAAFQLLGELTITARVWVNSAIPSGSSAQVILDANGAVPTNGLYTFFLNSTRQLSYYYETGTNVAHTVASTLTGPLDGHYHFVSLRRDAAGTTVRFGLDATYQDQAAPSAPVLRGNSPINIGVNDSNSDKFLGGLFDLSLWPTRLTDAQVDTLRVAVLGA